MISVNWRRRRGSSVRRFGAKETQPMYISDCNNSHENSFFIDICPPVLNYMFIKNILSCVYLIMTAFHVLETTIFNT